MANKPVTTDVATNAQYKAATLNANFATVEDAIENGLGRGGTSESNNSMQGDLDMDLNKIQNLDDPTTDLDAANLRTVEANLGANSLVNSAAAVASALAAAGYATDALNAQTAAETAQGLAEDAQAAAEAAASTITLAQAVVTRTPAWNPSGIESYSVLHGIADHSTIRSVSGIAFDNATGYGYPIGTSAGESPPSALDPSVGIVINRVDTDSVDLYVAPTSIFVSMSSVTIYLTIWYDASV